MFQSAFVESVVQDLRYARRTFAAVPVLTCAAVLAIAIGIASSTAVFSVVDRVLFRSLPYADPGQLVSIGFLAPIDRNEFMLGPDYLEWRAQQQPFAQLTAAAPGALDCDLTDTHPERLTCASVDQYWLPTLGVAPTLGRNFAADEDTPNGPKVALLSYGLWRSRFGADPDIVGRTISLDGASRTIVGVLARDFEMPTAKADVLLPLALDPAQQQRPKTGAFLRGFARLRPGVTAGQARAAMEPLYQNSLRYVPKQFVRDVRLSVRPLREWQLGNARTASWLLLIGVLAVLLIGCADVANLLLARSSQREREIAVRFALGARRSRVIRQLLTESIAICAFGGVLGAAMAYWLLRTFVAMAPSALPGLEKASLDGRVLAFTAFAAIASGIFAGLAPALQKPRAEALAGARTVVGARGFFRQALIVTQIALSLVLLSSATLLLRSLWNLESVPLGMSAEHIVTANIGLGLARYQTPAQQQQFWETLEQRMARIPDVQAFALSDTLPPSGGVHSMLLANIDVDGRPSAIQGTGGSVAWRGVTPGYFDALGIRVIRGRGFTEQDRATSADAVVLSESLARALFPNGDAIGQRVTFGKQPPWCTVIGIAGDVRNNGILQAGDPEYYRLRKRTPNFGLDPTTYSGRWASVAVRTSAAPQAMEQWIKGEITAIDPTLPVDLGTMQQRVGTLTARPRFDAELLTAFAIVGLLLAAIGLYGVMAFLVTQRTQEIGVRMAFGATPTNIVRLVLSYAGRWTSIGVAIGLLCAFWTTRLMRALLFGTSTITDLWLIGGTVLLLIAIAGIASWAPARRAARLDPVVALRRE
jgi:predicted permease